MGRAVKRVGSNIFVFESGEWSEVSVDGSRLACIRFDYVVDALDEAFGLEKRFGSGDEFAQWLGRFLRVPYLFSDEAICFPMDGFPRIDAVMGYWMAMLSLLQYERPERFDCDDFARAFQEFVAAAFKANVVGRLWGILRVCDEGGCEEGGHAYNWFVQPLMIDFEAGELYVAVLLVEPQIAAYAKPREDGSAVIELTNGYLEYDSYVALE